VTRKILQASGPPARPDLDINLRHLFVFMTVADAGSVAGAAEELFRASSAIGRAVSKLESALEVRLFDRQSRGMLLNAYGITVLERARRIAQELAAASEALDAIRAAGRAAGSSERGSGSRLIFSSPPNSRRLAIVTSLAERHNMAAVAREFAVTQAAISAGLKDLEDRLGMTLFTRSAKGVIPTDAGQILAIHFRRSLAELRNIGADLAAMEKAVHGTVKVGALPLGRTRILSSSIASAVTRYPRLRIKTTESPYDLLAAQLRSGDIDFIFGALRPAKDAKDLLQEALFDDDNLSVIARAGHPLGSRRTLTLGDLRNAQWALWREDSPARQALLRCFREAGETAPQPSVETGDLAVLRAVIMRSDILTAISAEQLHYEIACGELLVLPIRLGGTRRSIGIAQRHGALPSPGTRVLLDEIRARVDHLIEEGQLLKATEERQA
jgi:LysR family transcriptional regulator of gallate degradation